MFRNLLFATIAFLMTASLSLADQYKTVVGGKEYIVHTNPVPVVVHRILPPYWNKHISEREFKSGRLPASSRR